MFLYCSGKSVPVYQTLPEVVTPPIGVPATGDPGAPTCADVGTPPVNVGTSIGPSAACPYASPGRWCTKCGMEAGTCWAGSHGFGKLGVPCVSCTSRSLNVKYGCVQPGVPYRGFGASRFATGPAAA